MHRLATIGSIVLVSFLALGFAQERTKDKAPATFASLHAAVKSHHDAGRIGAAFNAAKELVAHLGVQRSDLIRAALPAAPDGFERLAKKDDAAQANPFAGALAGTVGNIIEQEYKKVGGGQSIRVTVTADSPMMGLVTMMFDNPAMLGPNAELIKYEQCNAILKKEGNRWSLQILIDTTLLDANFGSEDDDFALKMFDQAAVSKIAKVVAG